MVINLTKIAIALTVVAMTPIEIAHAEQTYASLVAATRAVRDSSYTLDKKIEIASKAMDYLQAEVMKRAGVGSLKALHEKFAKDGKNHALIDPKYDPSRIPTLTELNAALTALTLEINLSKNLEKCPYATVNLKNSIRKGYEKFDPTFECVGLNSTVPYSIPQGDQGKKVDVLIPKALLSNNFHTLIHGVMDENVRPGKVKTAEAKAYERAYIIQKAKALTQLIRFKILAGQIPEDNAVVKAEIDKYKSFLDLGEIKKGLGKSPVSKSRQMVIHDLATDAKSGNLFGRSPTEIRQAICDSLEKIGYDKIKLERLPLVPGQGAVVRATAVLEQNEKRKKIILPLLRQTNLAPFILSPKVSGILEGTYGVNLHCDAKDPQSLSSDIDLIKSATAEIISEGEKQIERLTKDGNREGVEDEDKFVHDRMSDLVKRDPELVGRSVVSTSADPRWFCLLLKDINKDNQEKNQIDFAWMMFGGLSGLGSLGAAGELALVGEEVASAAAIQTASVIASASNAVDSYLNADQVYQEYKAQLLLSGFSDEKLKEAQDSYGDLQQAQLDLILEGIGDVADLIDIAKAAAKENKSLLKAMQDRLPSHTPHHVPAPEIEDLFSTARHHLDGHDMIEAFEHACNGIGAWTSFSDKDGKKLTNKLDLTQAQASKCLKLGSGEIVSCVLRFTSKSNPSLTHEFTSNACASIPSMNQGVMLKGTDFELQKVEIHTKSGAQESLPFGSSGSLSPADQKKITPHASVNVDKMKSNKATSGIKGCHTNECLDDILSQHHENFCCRTSSGQFERITTKSWRSFCDVASSVVSVGASNSISWSNLEYGVFKNGACDVQISDQGRPYAFTKGFTSAAETQKLIALPAIQSVVRDCLQVLECVRNAGHNVPDRPTQTAFLDLITQARSITGCGSTGAFQGQSNQIQIGTTGTGTPAKAAVFFLNNDKAKGWCDVATVFIEK